MPRENKKSVVWEFYSKSTDNKVKCKLCSVTYKHFGNTSNLILHLKRKHPVDFIESGDGQQSSSTSSVVPASCPGNGQPRSNRPTSAVSNNLICATATHLNNEHVDGERQSEMNKEPPSKRQRQMRLTAPTKINQKTVDEALLDMIVLDYQPFQIVENVGFKRFTHKLNPDYTLPSRKVLSKKMLDERYSVCSSALRQKLSLVDNVALTTDIWTSDSTKSYLSITCHFILDAKMNSYILSTSEIPDDHTSENVAKAIKTIADEWVVFNKIVAIVTDNASNIKKAVSEILLKRNHFCVAHTLNLAVKDCTLKDNKETNDVLKDQLIALIAKCRSLVTHFNQSSKSCYKLKEIQKQMGLKELKLKQDVTTRWNATLFMLERLVKVKVPLSATLPQIQSSVSNLDSSEWDILDDTISLLNPIEDMSTFLCGESYPTLSCVIPLVRGLQSVINNKKPKTDIGKHLKKSLLEVIDKRLNVYEQNRTSAKATFLDPRFKKKAFGLDSNAENAQKWVIEELTSQPEIRLLVTEASQSHPSTSQLSSKERKEDDLWEVLDEKIAEVTTAQTPTSSATIIVKQYIEMPYLGRKENPVLFWEERKHIFPSMYKLANKYLCIPATSVPSERLFSKAGIVTNDRRNRLLPKKLDNILFLNSWYTAAYKN